MLYKVFFTIIIGKLYFAGLKNRVKIKVLNLPCHTTNRRLEQFEKK